MPGFVFWIAPFVSGIATGLVMTSLSATRRLLRAQVRNRTPRHVILDVQYSDGGHQHYEFEPTPEDSRLVQSGLERISALPQFKQTG